MSAKQTFGLFLALVAFSVLALACVGPQPLPAVPTSIPTLIPATLPPAPTAGGDQGAAIFDSNCSPCHNLTTERKVGPGLQGLFSFPSLPNGKAVNDANVAEWIRTGSPAGMPAFGADKLSDSDLQTLIAYLKQATAAGAQVTAAPTGGPQTPPGPASAGAVIFNSNCSPCHNLTTERKVGPGLQGLFSFPSLPNGKAVNDANVAEWIRTGSPAGMPAFGADKLSDSDLQTLIAYLKQATAVGATSPTAGLATTPGVTSTPGITTTPGALLVAGKTAAAFFQDNCSGCHGADRRGSVGPALLPERLSQADDYYFTTIRDGKPGTVMPPWGDKLSDQDIRNMIAFIRSEPPASSLQWTMDDITKTLTVLVDEATLPDKPTHSGNMDNLMLVTERETQKIAVIDGDSFKLLTEISASYRAHGYTFSPVNPRWAYNLGRDGWLFKIDLYTLQAVRKVRVGLDSRAVAISDDGRFFIAGNYVPATMVILDAETLRPLKVIAAQAANPEGQMIDSRVATILDTSPQLVGPYFLVALKEAGQVWRVDWSQPDLPITTVDNVGHILHDGFLSPDNRTFYLASQKDNWMAAIDVATMRVVARIGTGETPHPGSGAAWEVDGVYYGATVHASEGKIAIWNLSTNEMVATIKTPGPGLFIRSSDNSPYVWADAVFAQEPHAITVFEKTPPFQVVGVITDGVRTLHPEFTADGKYVYIADWDGNEVRVYDAHTLAKVAEISGIDSPTGIFNSSRRYETLGH